MPSLAILQPLLSENPRDFLALGASCGKFIDMWLAAGGEPTNDAVIGFYSLWSQSLDSRGKDEEGFYRWAHPLFLKHLGSLRTDIELLSPSVR